MHTLTEMIGTVLFTASTIPVLFVVAYLYTRYYQEKPWLFWLSVVVIAIIYFFAVLLIYLYLLDIGWIAPCKEGEYNLTASW